MAYKSEFGSVREINQRAEDLLNAGDFDGIRTLAANNGIPDMYVDAFFNGESMEFVDPMGAALGKLEMEEEDLNPEGVERDWIEYVKAQCMDNDVFAHQVMKKDKSLVGCMGRIAVWALINAKPLHPDIIKEMEKAGKENPEALKKSGIQMNWIKYTKSGAPSSGQTKKLIREYYIGGTA